MVKMTESEAERLINLEDILKKRVIGQEEAVTSISKAVRRARKPQVAYLSLRRIRLR